MIEATIEVLAAQGFARTTLSDVARRAGISHGLVNFHFKTKESLLAETLGYLSDEYLENWTTALAGAGENAAAQLDALIRADFEPAICSDARLGAWVAFWGEAQSRPLYQEICGENDRGYIRQMEDICARLIREGGYQGNATQIARVLRVTSEGVWMDIAATPNAYSRDEALQTVYYAAQAFFPHHFTDKGLI